MFFEDLKALKTDLSSWEVVALYQPLLKETVSHQQIMGLNKTASQKNNNFNEYCKHICM